MSRVAALIALLRQVIVDPTSNLTAAVLLLAAIVLIALIIVIGLLLWVTGGRRPEDEYADEEAEPVERDAGEYEYPELSAELAPELPGEKRTAPAKAAKPAGPVSHWLAGTAGTVAIWAIVAVALVAAFVGTSTDSYCADACHAEGTAVKSRAKDPHKTVACVSCHEDGGIAVGAASFQRLAHGVQRLAPGIHAYGGGVPAYRCLGCHSGIASSVATVKDLGVRVSHKEPLAGGMSCDDCHATAGHGGTLAKGMARCIACHDGKRASAECKTCHASDTSNAVRASDRRRIFSRVGLGPVTDCGGCHDQVSCDKCHGLRMPHSEQFVRWGHARSAGFGKKEACWRCHTGATCGRCHTPFENGHQTDWRTKHMGTRATMDAKCGCHWTKMPPQGQATAGLFCRVCH